MIFRYRATIPESKIFYRVYKVEPEMTLFDFHKYILGDLAFSPDQMVLFEGYDENGCLCSQYCLFDMGDGSMDKVRFSDVAAKGEVELHYVFDMRNDRFIKMVFEEEEVESPRVSYPDMAEGKGLNPDQFTARFEAAEEPRPVPHVVKGGDDEGFDDDDDDDDDDGDEDGDGGEDEGEELLVDEDFGKEG